MPRLNPRDLHRVARLHGVPFAHVWIGVRGDMAQAQAEYAWIVRESPAALVRQRCLRRSRGEPLQYVLGNVPFAGLVVRTARHVLIPRWETEEWALHLAQRARKYLPRVGSIVDLCCGSGCIGLALTASLHPREPSMLVDVSPAAIALCTRNARAAAQAPRIEQCDIANMPAPLVQAVRQADIIVANPPYIPAAEFAGAGPTATAVAVRRSEPALALLGGGADGALYHRYVIRAVGTGGRMLVMEVNDAAQAAVVADELCRAGWPCTAVWWDTAGQARAVAAWRDALWTDMMVGPGPAPLPPGQSSALGR